MKLGTSAHLNGVFHKSLPTFCVSACVGKVPVKTFPRQRIQATTEELLDACVCGSVYPPPLSLLGNNHVKTFPRQQTIIAGVVFYAVPVVSKESRQLVLPSPRGGRFEYFHRIPASSRSQRKGKPMPGGITGPPCSWGI
jgi:hypothetical protein